MNAEGLRQYRNRQMSTDSATNTPTDQPTEPSMDLVAMTKNTVTPTTASVRGGIAERKFWLRALKDVEAPKFEGVEATQYFRNFEAFLANEDVQHDDDKIYLFKIKVKWELKADVADITEECEGWEEFKRAIIAEYRTNDSDATPETVDELENWVVQWRDMGEKRISVKRFLKQYDQYTTEMVEEGRLLDRDRSRILARAIRNDDFYRLYIMELGYDAPRKFRGVVKYPSYERVKEVLSTSIWEFL